MEGGEGVGWGGSWLAVAISRGNKQGVTIFSGAQAVTAGMVSWCLNGLNGLQSRGKVIAGACNGMLLHVLITA